MKKLNNQNYLLKRSEEARKKFTKVHALKNIGMNDKQILSLMEMEGRKISLVQIGRYLQQPTYEDMQKANKVKNELARLSKKSKTATKTAEEVEAVKEVEEDVQAMDFDRENINKVLDLIAEAYEMLKRIKWRIK